jgi:hypothetical protein
VPNFCIIGAAKAGTTSLSSLLGAHPEAGIVRGKEPHYFSQGGLSRDAYLKLFSHCIGKKAIGDASTSYSRIRYYPQMVDRIWRHCPDLRIIYMVRHPLRRMESAYVEHLCTAASVPFQSINDAISRAPMIVDSSRYWEVFDAYRQRFDESRIKVVWFEEYIADVPNSFRDVCRFLEIDNSALPDFRLQKTNSGQQARQRMASIGRGNIVIDTNWDPEIRQSVISRIREDICRFLGHFQRPLNYWGEVF